MHFSNFSNMLSVIFMLLMVIACATGQYAPFECPNAYCVFEDRLTQPINYAFGPAGKPKIPLGDFVTCEHSKLPVGTPVNTCCDQSVGDVINRSHKDPLIVWYDDYNRHGCHEVPELSGPDI
ncbi:uncharacterized protein PGTG_06979 [Puccinia graminis f. sp. tritici CRL 75-36-700-3]|uniref:Hydrophobin n=1 Tax=Puccinia graminis f. sp. tritici (strain CRL 75-36-700-3 / race SCCL) TaxID=418459 RepID=E3KAW8_PUCGT|nr:uncharacterized protein PGTG_06979 [Puccinia graminis f. sp. tritici CRL 75-36-700-3]EFP81358.2 hypothetical protein PGTG_06979 [Puccinia graminis f. sp. tritici CRL 75-36-700-3]